MCRKLLTKWICKPKFLEELKQAAKKINASDFKIITTAECRNILLKDFKEYLNRIYMNNDHFYYLYDDNVQKIFDKIYLKYKLGYEPELFNCDDFALDYLSILRRFTRDIPGAKYPFAIGICQGIFPWINGYHAANIMITHTDSPTGALYEPQNGHIYYSEDNSKWNDALININYW